MIIDRLNELASKTIILASTSPRRKEILQKLSFTFEVIPSNFVEDLDPNDFSHPSEFVKKTAKGKALEVAENLHVLTNADMIISADTAVSLNGKVFGKPKNKGQAINMLTKLSGKDHDVVTGVHILWRHYETKKWNEIQFHESTQVSFADLSHDVIKAYVDTGEPMDKAGAYGIQGTGGCLIRAIRGDYYNVMGFPLHSFTTHLGTIMKAWSSCSGE